MTGCSLRDNIFNALSRWLLATISNAVIPLFLNGLVLDSDLGDIIFLICK